MQPPGPLNAARLPPGTQVGPWRIVDLRGRGAYGTVYLAQGVEPEATGEVALKLALAPRDERFPREVGLLSRVSHPCIPRLVDQGQWLSPFGLPHPFVVMEWLEGIPLYVWARDLNPSSRKVLGVLAGVARALAAVHSEGAVHRDIKGDNILVRLEDGRGFLMDFGSSHYQGADTLTWQVFPPGTPAYRSPEAYQFALNLRTAPVKVYSPGPGDDLFALGVTAYRLVTGQYPPTRVDPQDAQAHVWDPDGPGPRPARELNPGCCPELSTLISRMLSIHPEARGSAHELAGALEQATKEAGPEADAPLFHREPPREAVPRHLLRTPPRPVHTEVPAQPLTPRVPQRNPSPWLTAAGLGVSMTLAAWVLSTASRREEATQEPVARQEESSDAGTAAVGEATLTAPVASAHIPSSWSPIALDMPSKPLRGQTRPDASGRCPRPPLVAINGGCWIKTSEDPKDCGRYSYVYKGGCYEPAFSPPPPATSAPVEARDGG